MLPLRAWFGSYLCNRKSATITGYAFSCPMKDEKEATGVVSLSPFTNVRSFIVRLSYHGTGVKSLRTYPQNFGRVYPLP